MQLKELSSNQLKKWIEGDRKLILIDVREPFERKAFNIGGKHIPLGELMQQTHEIDKEIPVVFYCEKGVRSAIAIQRLEAKGFSNLYNLRGGIAAWKKEFPH